MASSLTSTGITLNGTAYSTATNTSATTGTTSSSQYYLATRYWVDHNYGGSSSGDASDIFSESEERTVRSAGNISLTNKIGSVVIINQTGSSNSDYTATLSGRWNYIYGRDLQGSPGNYLNINTYDGARGFYIKSGTSIPLFGDYNHDDTTDYYYTLAFAIRVS